MTVKDLRQELESEVVAKSREAVGKYLKRLSRIGEISAIGKPNDSIGSCLENGQVVRLIVLDKPKSDADRCSGEKVVVSTAKPSLQKKIQKRPAAAVNVRAKRRGTFSERMVASAGDMYGLGASSGKKSFVSEEATSDADLSTKEPASSDSRRCPFSATSSQSDSKFNVSCNTVRYVCDKKVRLSKKRPGIVGPDSKKIKKGISGVRTLSSALV